MLNISFEGTDQRVIQALEQKGPRLVEVLMGKLTELMLQLKTYIVEQKLSGQVLSRRSGVLSGSIRAIPATLEGTKIVGAVEGGGGPAFYAAVHEYGGSAPYQIIATRARALAFVMGGKQVFANSVTHPPAIARPFMSTSLAENAATIEAELRAAVDQVVAE